MQHLFKRFRFLSIRGGRCLARRITWIYCGTRRIGIRGRRRCRLQLRQYLIVPFTASGIGALIMNPTVLLIRRRMPFRFFPVMPGSRHALGVLIAAAALVGALALADAGGHCLADQLVVVHVHDQLFLLLAAALAGVHNGIAVGSALVPVMTQGVGRFLNDLTADGALVLAGAVRQVAATLVPSIST